MNNNNNNNNSPLHIIVLAPTGSFGSLGLFGGTQGTGTLCEFLSFGSFLAAPLARGTWYKLQI